MNRPLWISAQLTRAQREGLVLLILKHLERIPTLQHPCNVTFRWWVEGQEYGVVIHSNDLPGFLDIFGFHRAAAGVREALALCPLPVVDLS